MNFQQKDMKAACSIVLQGIEGTDPLVMTAKRKPESKGLESLTLVPFRKFPMARRVDRMKPRVLLFSSWSIPSFRSKSGSATSFQIKRKQEMRKNTHSGFLSSFPGLCSLQQQPAEFSIAQDKRV